ncbi:hypothetical protein ACWGI0_21160 [Streptomyces sp. NPDC054802]
MPNARASHLTRRGLLTAGGALGLGVALAACGQEKKDGTKDTSAKSAAESGPWSFEDDRGMTAEAKSTPEEHPSRCCR